MSTYDFASIESTWQQRWRELRSFAAGERGDLERRYVLDMFPYPSGDGLHVGHVKIYTASDVFARYLRMRGYDVLHPTGWDAFGLPTENTAIKRGVHPAELTKQNVDRFRGQMQRLGLSYDWDREITTTDPAYYRWTQWIFLQLFNRGLAYQDVIPINWCPGCKTGLSNEEVIDGVCERCGSTVELKPMRQWLLRITQYADRLLEGLDDLAWPQFILELQRNWIGRSEGAQLSFTVRGSALDADASVDVFTTRADTLFGATYLVLAPEHPLVAELLATKNQELRIKNYGEVASYVEGAGHKTELMRKEEEKEKTGVVLDGVVAVNPATGEEIPVWVADYVLLSYGTGAIMAVPAHDERDWDFAQRFGLPIRKVIADSDVAETEQGSVYSGEGTLVDSGEFTGMSSDEARRAITEHVGGTVTVMYKLRDWVFSRQRYWGEPIPIIHCDSCGTVPVPEEDLPVTLPEVERYEPTGTGESPLAAVEEWVTVSCPTCGNSARRETNTMPQWAGSSWYWLRYCDPRNDTVLAAPDALAQWMPVDTYVGGAEHAVLHLLYARFWSFVLADVGAVREAEPFRTFQSVGLVLGEDGQKMSKSRGNVVNPDDVIAQYGADTLRVYTCFMGPFDASIPWSAGAISGAHRFLQRVWRLFELRITKQELSDSGKDEDLQVMIHQTIKRVTDGIEGFRFNTSIAALMELLNELERQEKVDRSLGQTFVLLLAPFAPHIAEALWERLGHSDSLVWESWPSHDAAILSRAAVSISVQVNGKVRGELMVDPNASQNKVERAARALPRLDQYVSEDHVVRRVVYVPGRMINFVVDEG